LETSTLHLVSGRSEAGHGLPISTHPVGCRAIQLLGQGTMKLHDLDATDRRILRELQLVA
jgi:hypothetical protein